MLKFPVHTSRVQSTQVCPFALRWLNGKESAYSAEMWVQSLGQEDPLEEEMATQSTILAWEVPWAVEPNGLQSIGSQRVGHA